MSTAGVVTENVMPRNEYGRRSLGNSMCGGSSRYKNDGEMVLHRWLVHENQLPFTCFVDSVPAKCCVNHTKTGIGLQFLPSSV
jgi:hypothetical protein